MQCPICGLVSQTPDLCSWCKKPLPAPASAQPQASPPPTVVMPPHPNAVMPPSPTMSMPPQPTVGMAPHQQPTMAMPPQPNMGTAPSPYASAPAVPPGGMQQRMSLTGEVMEVPVAPPPVAPGMQPTQSMAPGGMRSPHYGPPGTLPAAAYSTAYIGQQVRQDQAPPGEQWEKYLAIAFPLLALSMFLVHRAPHLYLWIAMADLFFMGLAMGATRTIPAYEDSFADCTIVLVLCFLFGPLLALIVYGIVGLVKQEFNTAVLSLLALTLGVPYVLNLAFISSATQASQFVLFGLFSLMWFVAVVVAFAGWILSSFFRPIGE
jgi:hypothetical protein